MLKELYNKYKFNYKDYILLIKSGNFYISLNNDAIVMNNIFNYKIKESTNFIKVGFPINSELKVKNYLDIINVNYVVIDEYIIDKRKFQNNKYNEYSSKHNYRIYLNRIKRINDILKANLNNNISSILDEIEDGNTYSGYGTVKDKLGVIVHQRQ